jgi:hypothetical protein
VQAVLANDRRQIENPPAQFWLDANVVEGLAAGLAALGCCSSGFGNVRAKNLILVESIV